ncbi:MAG TPA: MOSC N-terminal beta barrel domain-containing protein [Paracoccaceae bacterium]|nr:MOSC N-terminal beta barrel domain-containing protein [Paracoccaceae bacterium]
MSCTLAEIYRHPVKSLGEEALDAVALTAGRPVPWDRVWAVAHGGAEWQGGRWAPPATFVNQTHVPRLAQIGVAFDEAAGRLTLRHPDLPELAVTPGTTDGDAALTDWIAPLVEGTPRQGPFTVAWAESVQFTDFEETHVSIGSLSSRRALEEIAGQPLEPIRFRMNLWLEGLSPWEDLDLVGRDIEVGPARLRVIRRDARCNATTASPATGERDVPVVALLKKTFGHTDFGIYAQVVRGGTVRRGDAARIL